FPEPAVEGLDVLEHLEPLLLGHLPEAGHDAVPPHAERQRPSAAGDSLGHRPVEVGGYRQFPGRSRAELEDAGRKVPRLRRPPRRKHRAHGPVSLPVDAVAHHAGHRVDVTPDRNAPRMLRSEEHTSELQSLPTTSYALIC